MVAFRRLGEALGQAPLDIELPSGDHLYLCRVSLEETISLSIACLLFPKRSLDAPAKNGRYVSAKLHPSMRRSRSELFPCRFAAPSQYYSNRCVLQHS